MEIEIDNNIYSDSVISKVVYWLSGEYVVERKRRDNTDILCITTNDESGADELLRKKIFLMLNDQKLRNIIEEETKDIRTILYAKAFADFDDLTEEDLSE